MLNIFDDEDRDARDAWEFATDSEDEFSLPPVPRFASDESAGYAL